MATNIPSHFYSFAYGRLFFSIEGKEYIEKQLKELVRINIPMFAIKNDSYLNSCNIEKLLDIACSSNDIEKVICEAWYEFLCTIAIRINAEKEQAYADLHTNNF